MAGTLFDAGALCCTGACRGAARDRCTRRVRQEASVRPSAPSVCTDSVSARSATTSGTSSVVGAREVFAYTWISINPVSV